MPKIKPLRTDADYQEALAELHKCWLTTDPLELDAFEVLAVLVDDYERRHTPIEENSLDKLAQQPGPILPEVHFTTEELERISRDDDNYEPAWVPTPQERSFKPGVRVRHKISRQTGNINRILVEMAVDTLGTFTYNIDNIEPESK